MSLPSLRDTRNFIKVPIWFFVFNNLILIYGLVIQHWKVSDIFLFFVIEIFVVGIISIIKIILLKEKSMYIKMHAILVFLIWYGMLTTALSWTIINKFEIQIETSVLYTIPLVLLAHICLLIIDYFKNNFNSSMRPMDLATESLPKMRIIISVMPFVVGSGSNLLGLTVFIFVKTCIDYAAYKPTITKLGSN